MSKTKAYKEQEDTHQIASEPMTGYSCVNSDCGIVRNDRDNIKNAISGEELLDKLRPRLKALFK